MPAIPQYVSKVSASADNPDFTPVQDSGADMQAAQMAGRGAQQLGQDLQNTSRSLAQGAAAIAELQQKQTNADIANGVANFDYTSQANDLKTQMPPDGSGYQQAVVTGYKNAVTDYVNNMPDDDTRIGVRNRLMSELPAWSKQAADYEYTTKQTNLKLNTDDALNTLTNRATQDPTAFQTVIDNGNAVIAATPGLTAGLKAGMMENFKQETGKAAIQGQINRATTVSQLDALSAQMAQYNGQPGEQDWATILKPTDYHTLLDQIGSARRTMSERNKAGAEAAISGINQRLKDPLMPIGSDEMASAQQTVAQAGDMVMQQKMARAQRDNVINQSLVKLPPDQIRAQINQVQGDPGAAYPGLPPEVSGWINNTAAQTGIPASYLGGLVTREYGGELAKGQTPQLSAAYAPQMLNQNADARNIRPDVMAAVTMAGQSIGKPLQVIATSQPSPVSSTAGGNITLSTLGMTDDDKAKMVGALVDAGFTGFSQNQDSMLVGMAQSVPAQFGRDDNGQTWGGWTYLSPAVAQTLKDKGFAAGASSDIIKRNNPFAAPAINYGVTGVSGTGNGTATGLTQFTKSTWLDMVKNPANAARMGIDLSSNPSDEELLQLRSNPQIALAGAAVYAQQNKNTLQNTLGRPVTDGELYMAHFLGPSGAVALISGAKSQPTASAADLLPDAAKNNPNVFYDKNKQPLTTQQVYNNISNSFTLDPTRIAWEDNEQRKVVLNKVEEGLKNDPVSLAAQTGQFVVSPIDDSVQSYQTRSQQAIAIANYNSIPLQTMKPFTEDEANGLKKQIDDGGSERALQIMSGIANMNPQIAQGAMSQLDVKNPTFGYAGRLYLGGARGTAADVMRGQDMLAKNPSLKKDYGIDDNVLSAQMNQAIGTSLSTWPQDQAKAAQEAALALWVQRNSTMKSAPNFGASGNTMSFSDAINEVLGGTPNSPAVQMVNGKSTLLPSDGNNRVSGGDVEQALQNLTQDDMSRLSVDGQPPVYRDNTPVDPYTIRNDAMLLPKGGGKYQVQLSDKTLLMKKDGTPYMMTLTPKDIKEIGSRPMTIQQQSSNFWNRLGEGLEGLAN